MYAKKMLRCDMSCSQGFAWCKCRKHSRASRGASRANIREQLNTNESILNAEAVFLKTK